LINKAHPSMIRLAWRTIGMYHHPISAICEIVTARRATAPPGG
jgi:hypothetical protein